MIDKKRPLEEKLNEFFTRLRSCMTAHARPFLPSDLELRLPDFLNEHGEVLARDQKNIEQPAAKHLADLEHFGRWLISLKEPIAAAKRAGAFCDPWQIAGLRRDEVRNASVLAWLLDPRGSHGFGDRMLRALLTISSVEEVLGKVDEPGACRVYTESCPDGDRASRVDIEIDSPFFYLIIEVKIDAVEGENQLERYCKIASEKSKTGQWGVIFLTPKGKGSNSIGGHELAEKVIPLKWRKLASIFEEAISQHKIEISLADANQLMTTLLLVRFIEHIRKFK